jgi:Type III secretion system lipoprotein chaperone (YscW)
VRGAFAGTLSPQPMDSRADGALTRVSLQSQNRLAAEYETLCRGGSVVLSVQDNHRRVRHPKRRTNRAAHVDVDVEAVTRTSSKVAHEPQALDVEDRIMEMTIATRSAALVALLTLSAGTALAHSIEGTATYRERMALPPAAVFEAVLEDVSRADASAVTIAQIRLTPPGNPPITFTIAYDPRKIVANHRYAVRA